VFVIKLTMNEERGATMVEFAICLIAFIMLIGGVFDLGLLIRRYSLLDNAVRKSSRDAVVRASTSGNCADAREYIRDEGNDYLLNSFGIQGVSWNGTWRNRAGQLGTRPSLHLEAQTRAECYFLCNMFPSGFNLSVSNEVSVDNQFLIDQEGCQDFSV